MHSNIFYHRNHCCLFLKDIISQARAYLHFYCSNRDERWMTDKARSESYKQQNWSDTAAICGEERAKLDRARLIRVAKITIPRLWEWLSQFQKPPRISQKCPLYPQKSWSNTSVGEICFNKTVIPTDFAPTASCSASYFPRTFAFLPQ